MPPRRSKKPAASGAITPAASRLRPKAGALGTAVTSPRRPGADAERRRAEKLVAEVQHRKKRIASDFYEMGRALAQLAEPRTYQALGYQAFDDLLRDRRLMSRIQAYKLIEVTRAYPKPVALSLGIEKAYSLHRYVAATPAADLAAELARRDARIGDKAISRLTVDDLRDFTRRVERGAPAAGTTPAIPASARTRARELQRELRRRGAKSARVRARPDGATVLLEIRLALDDADAVLG